MERFWKKVNKTDTCWLWIGAGNRYGQLTVDHKSVYAHRYIWEVTFGAIPEGMCVCHKCDVMRCVRPDHLFLGTADDNMKDCASKGRTARQRGEQCGMARMSDKIVQEIREATKTESNRAIARRYGFGYTTVWKVVQRVTWQHV